MSLTVWLVNIFYLFQQFYFCKMILRAETVVLVLCGGGCFYSVYYCLEKYLEDQSLTNVG
jgi:hypothetical protein